MSIAKQLEWIFSAKKDLCSFPDDVKDEIGFVLWRIQEGKKPASTKPLKGFDVGVMEIVTDYDTNTYRTVFVLNLNQKIYVLHCFKKKSKHGRKTPKPDIETIRQRLNWLKHELKGSKIK